MYRRKLRRAKAIERGLKMVPILIHLPPPSSDTTAQGRDVREVMREKIAQAEVLYNLISGTATEGYKSKFFGQRHVALELIASGGLVHFYAAVPVGMSSIVEKAIQTAYPGAKLEEVEDHNIFNQQGRLAATIGGEMVLKNESAYPIAVYTGLERDPMEAIITTLSSIGPDDGAAIQIMIRPADPLWTKRSSTLANSLRKGRNSELKFSAMDLAKAVVKTPTARVEQERGETGVATASNLQLSQVESIEEKTKHPGFEILIRVLVSTESVAKSQQLLRDLATAFALFEKPGLNGLKFLPALDVQGIVTAFIFRFFPPEIRSNVLNSAELATIFHLPDSQFTPTMNVERQKSKEVDGPVRTADNGLLFGTNEFRGVKKEIRLSIEDRRRHTYVLGQTGTGKSTMLENLAVQDMIAGNGFAFIDPHGESAEKLLSLVPKNRAEDVIYFNPADTEYPLGLNLFEFNDPAQKDFLIQESISMLYKLYDPNGTGVIGPRFEQWFRNAALTLMSDPNGATFIEIPKVFTDTDYLKQKFRYLKDPTVIDFWTKEMGQTSDYHKSEMLGYFVSKFGAFQQNEIMRNIIGQTKSAFNLRDVMDQKKILIVNLSKGRIGELNSRLLGMMFVIKFQAAAMSRTEIPEDQRYDFSLYVDEFQNFSTDSFASILSEARKYRLNLIVANQFIGQLTNEIRDAVFGNVGTIVAHRMGPEDAEFMVKQFAPIFDAGDLVNIPNYHSVLKLLIGGLPSQPFTMTNLPPIGHANAELGLAIKQLSAAKFGMTKAMVEADLMSRLSGTPVPVAVAAPAPIPTPVPDAVAPPAAPSIPAAPVLPVAAPVEVAPPVTVATSPPPLPELVAVAAAVVAPPAPTSVDAPVALAPSIVPADSSNLAAVPPPIGAPPVDLGPLPEPAPVASSRPDGLSIHDITGGKPPATSTSNVVLPDVELIPEGAEPPAPLTSDPLSDVPLLASPAPEIVPVPEPPQEAPIAPIVPSVPVPAEAATEPATVGLAVDEPKPCEAAPEVLDEPEPRESSEPVPEPVLESPESLIHFVDPKLETVLERPDAPVLPPLNEPIPELVSASAEQPVVATPAVSLEAVPPIGAPPVRIPEILPGSMMPVPSVEPAATIPVAPMPPVQQIGEAATGRSTDDAVAAVLAAASAREQSGQGSTTSTPAAISVSPEPPIVVAEETPPVTPSQAITEAEDEIDDLLNVSLIHNDHSSHPLPSPDESRESSDARSGSDAEAPPHNEGRHWISSEPAASESGAIEGVADVMLDGGDMLSAPTQSSGSDNGMASTHNKVIEPLEPIVSRREELAQAVMATEPDEVTDVAMQPESTPPSPSHNAATPTNNVDGTEAPLPTIPPSSTADVVPTPEAAPDISVTAIATPDDDALPQPVSLAAADVAAVKAEESAVQTPEAAEPSPEPVADLSTAPMPSATTTASVNKTAEHTSSRRRHRGGRNSKTPTPEGAPSPTLATESASPVEAAPPVITTGSQPESMAGKLILPTAVSQSDVVVAKPAVTAEQPPALAKGEIYVDSKGNVIVGE